MAYLELTERLCLDAISEAYLEAKSEALLEAFDNGEDTCGNLLLIETYPDRDN